MSRKFYYELLFASGGFILLGDFPAPKVEPLKRWLAKVGYERVQEIENPELAMQRMRGLYEKKAQL